MRNKKTQAKKKTTLSKQTIVKRINNGSMLFKNLPEELKNDEDICLAAAEYAVICKKPVEEYAEHVKDKKDFYIDLREKERDAYRSVPDDMLKDAGFVLDYMNRMWKFQNRPNVEEMEYILSYHREDPDVMHALAMIATEEYVPLLGHFGQEKDFAESCVEEKPVSVIMFPCFNRDLDLQIKAVRRLSELEMLSDGKLNWYNEKIKTIIRKIDPNVWADTESLLRFAEALPVEWFPAISCARDLMFTDKESFLDILRACAGAGGRISRLDLRTFFYFPEYYMFGWDIKEDMQKDWKWYLDAFADIVPDWFMSDVFKTGDPEYEKQVLLYGFKKAAETGADISPDYRYTEDRDIAFALIRAVPDAEAHRIAYGESGDPEWWEEAVRANPWNITVLNWYKMRREHPDALKRLAKEAVSMNGLILRELIERHKYQEKEEPLIITYELMEAAVRQNHEAILCIPKEYLDRNMALLGREPKELRHLPDAVRNDPEIIAHYIRFDKKAIHAAGTDFLLGLYALAGYAGPAAETETETETE